MVIFCYFIWEKSQIWKRCGY